MTRDVHQHEPTLEGDLDRRQLLKRLGVGGAIVWTVPLLAQSPAAADHTTCNWTEHLFQWGDLPRQPQTGADLRAAWPVTDFLLVDRTGVHPDVTLSIASAFYEGYDEPGPTPPTLSAPVESTSFPGDRHIVDGPYGGVETTDDSFMMVYQTARRDSGRVFTFTFSEPVRNVRFHITDIDYQRDDNSAPINPGAGQYDDRVRLVGDPGVNDTSFSPTFPTGSGVSGASTDGSPLMRVANGNIGDASVAATALVTHADELTTFTLDFRCQDRAYNGSHAIFLGPIRFETCEEPPAP